MALLSIIIPVYNKEAYIDACVQSVLKQTFADFELILVNDGSTDKSGKKCDHYSQLDKRVVVIHQHNQGVSAARNAGLDAAAGGYIGFVDCDDELDADMYETLINTVLTHKADIAICGVRKIHQHKTELYYNTSKVKVYNRAAAINGLFKKEFARSVYDKIFKAEIAKKIKFEGSINEDTFYNFEALFEADVIVFNDVAKYNYIIRDTSVSMTKFSKKYLDIISFSKRMVEKCREKMPHLVNEAKYFDLVNNISLLNLIILSGKQQHLDEYKQVADNLKGYSKYIASNPISKKHKYAYALFSFSPAMYGFLMKVYCKIADADVSKKK